jgi:lipopolysaccharide transport system ATP-binding protein
MTSGTAAVEVANLSKVFSLEPVSASAATSLATAFKRAFKRTEAEEFSAVNDVSFEVHPGESVGLIGRNGAGKSSLLKVLARVTPPTSGRIVFRGSVGSLLEVGAGFHGELSGRENIFLNGAILGMKGSDVRAAFDDIVEFSGVGPFLDTPVKRFSSGMYVRLAFAVAAHLRTDILLVDEVLAVGDTAFQQQSLNKMSELAKEGRTILFVSHHMPSIRQLCTRGIVLEKGSLHFDGPVDAATDQYRLLQESEREQRMHRAVTAETSAASLRFIQPVQATFRPDEPKRFAFGLSRGKESADYSLCFVIRDDTGTAVTKPETRSVGGWFAGDQDHEGTFVLSRPWLAPGQYSIDVWLDFTGDVAYGACTFTVSDESPYDFDIEPWVAELSPVLAEFSVEPKLS